MVRMNERERIRAAKQMPSPIFSWRVECTLSNLPPRDAQKHKAIDFAKALPWVAVVVITLAVAGPPIARAAIPYIQRLFASYIENIRDDLDQPESARIEQNVIDIETYTRSHPVDASAQVGDVTVRLEEFRFSNNPAGPHRGELSISLAFPSAPERFDPAAIEFTLEENGQSIQPIQVEQRGIAGDGEGWDNVFFMDGVMHCSLRFVYDAWDTEEATSFTLYAQLPGGKLYLPIAYDPALAHAESQRKAQERQPTFDAHQHEKLEAMENMASSAVPVGAAATAQGITFSIEEMSILEGTAYFPVSVMGYETTSAKLGAMDFFVKDFQVDSWPAPVGGGQSDEALVDGVLTFIEYKPLPLADQEFNATSLFSLTGKCFSNGVEFPIVFRYSWETRAVTLPADEMEREAWIEEAKASKHVTGMEADVLFPLGIQTVSDQGKTYTLEAVWFWSTGGMRVQVAAEDRFPGEPGHYLAHVDIDGQQARDQDSREVHPNRAMIGFDMQPVVPYPKLPADIPLNIVITASDANHVNGEAYPDEFHFNVTLRRDDAIVFD